MSTLRTAGLAAVAVLALAPAAQARPAPDVAVQQAAGTSAAAIQSTVDAYRADLGANNGSVAGSRGAGRREINWDGGGDAPAPLAGDFFNITVPRGAEFTTPGDGFRVSGKAASGQVEFDDIRPGLSGIFAAFSPEKLFTAVNSRRTKVRFFVPGTKQRATVSGFGAVFTDVDRYGSTRLSYYDAKDRHLGTYLVPASPARESLSFLGVRFKDRRVSKVRIKSGNASLGKSERQGRDRVVMDDFVYGEPIAR